MNGREFRRPGTLVFLTIVALLSTPGPAEAYVGPGAGFTFVTAFFFILASFVVGFFSILTWPFRYAVAWMRRRKTFSRRRCRRLIIVGLDGMDFGLTEEMMAEGKLPQLKQIADAGSFRALATTCPAISPVAWSSFMTGCNPGRHNIYDFLSRDPRSYLPTLSSSKIHPPRRVLRLGKYRVPLGRPIVRMLRKSRPFWQVLGEHGVFSNVIRVPITFPPQRFNGVLLSGMCVPDLRGSQGTFTHYTTGKAPPGPATGGIRMTLEESGGMLRGVLPGPANAITEANEELRLPFRIAVNGRTARLSLPDQRLTLREGEYSPWVRLTFNAGLRIKVRGIARFLVTQTHPEFKMYVTPIHIDPAKPPFPVSHPYAYAVYLAKQFGPFATLGLAEDTWALSEQVIGDEDFLTQAYAIHQEREAMQFDALDKTREGLVVCVFDTPDRIQHMFFRYLNPEHPALAGRDRTAHVETVDALYRKMDDLIGRIRARMRPGDHLIVMSDHGFKDFSRGVDINAYLMEKGYLSRVDGKEDEKWLAAVDWSRTRAYALGLGGLYLNLKGRERDGIVAPGREEEALKQELIAGLTGMKDPGRDGRTAIRRVFDRTEIYDGPYRDNAPDLMVGYEEGYRVSWDCVQGRVTSEVFSDNTRAWSGDHCVDPELVPGILFATFKVAKEAPHIMDLAPTALNLLGVETPAYMDGESVL